MTLALFAPDGAWMRVTKFDPRAAALADRHYSRQTVGSPQFLPNGRTLVLLTHDASAVWGICDNLDPAGARRFRCTIFRNEGGGAFVRSRSRGDAHDLRLLGVALPRLAARPADDGGRPQQDAPQARSGAVLPPRWVDAHRRRARARRAASACAGGCVT